VIARVQYYALDCPDPQALAEFYRKLTGWEISYSDEEWVTLNGPDAGAAGLAFQRVDGYRPPRWPSQEHPQQAHLDLEVDDLDTAERQVLELGARPLDVEDRERSYRVYADPAGHPFCLVRARPSR